VASVAFVFWHSLGAGLFLLVLCADRFRVLGVLGISFGLAGVLLAIVPNTESLPSPDMVGRVLLAPFASMMFALVTVFAGKYGRAQPPRSTSPAACCSPRASS
jgi:drug/metabolite transporter (DMT)-like permease